MGRWGMGIAQSDEYSEVYDRFIEEYDEGKPVAHIRRDILSDYLEEFDPADGVMHDVYFALAKAEWLCGGISEDLLKLTERIINEGENLGFLRSLEASEKDLRARQRHLEKFLSGLLVPRAKPRARKIPEEKYVPRPLPAPLPQAQCGDILCYLHEGSFRAFTLTKKDRFMRQPALFCYAWRKKFDSVPDFEQLLKEDFVPLGYFNGERFPDLNKISLIGNFPVINELGRWEAHSISKMWRPVSCAWANEELLQTEYPEEVCISLEEALSIAERLKIKYPD